MHRKAYIQRRTPVRRVNVERRAKAREVQFGDLAKFVRLMQCCVCRRWSCASCNVASAAGGRPTRRMFAASAPGTARGSRSPTGARSATSRRYATHTTSSSTPRASSRSRTAMGWTSWLRRRWRASGTSRARTLAPSPGDRLRCAQPATLSRQSGLVVQRSWRRAEHPGPSAIPAGGLLCVASRCGGRLPSRARLPRLQAPPAHALTLGPAPQPSTQAAAVR